MKILKFPRFFLALSLLCALIGGAFSPFCFAESAEPEQLSLPFPATSLADLAPKLTRKIKEAYAVISSKKTTAAEKEVAVDDFFKTVDLMCVENCDVLIQQLQQVNDALEPLRKRQAVNPLAEIIPDEQSKELLAHGVVVADWAKQIEAAYKKDPAATVYRMRAAIEAIKALVTFQQEALLKALSSDPNEKNEASLILKRDLGFLMKQGRALVRIVNIFVNHPKDAESFTESEVKEIVGSLRDLGIFYIKVAQSLSNLSSALPQELTSALKGFQDKMERLEPSVAETIIRAQLGRDPHEIYTDLDLSKPVSCASVGCTYRAKIKKALGGFQEVAVKVQRPNLKPELDYNRRLNAVGVKLLRVLSFPAIAPIMDIVSDEVVGLEDAFEGELNYRTEARNLQRYGRIFALDKNVRIPKIYPKYCAEKVLTMEWMSGSNLENEYAPLAERSHKFYGELSNDLDAKQRAEAKEKFMEENPDVASVETMFGQIFESTIYMTLVVNDLHADLHPGNILADSSSGKLAFVDLGQTLNTKGLVYQPVKAGYHLYLGDAEGLTQDLVGMSKTPEFPKEVVRSVIDEVFKEFGIEPVKVNKALRGHQKLPALDNLGKAAAKITRKLYNEKNYRASTRYFPFLRSACPVTSSLLMLGRGLPPVTIAKVALKSFAKGYVLGNLKKWALFAPTRFGGIYDEITMRMGEVSQIKEIQKSQRRQAEQCRAIFAD